LSGPPKSAAKFTHRTEIGVIQTDNDITGLHSGLLPRFLPSLRDQHALPCFTRSIPQLAGEIVAETPSLAAR